jgi:hypothetical protein
MLQSPTVEAILSTERNRYLDVYHSTLPFSGMNGTERFNGKTILQWLFCMRPYHPFLTRYLSNLVFSMKKIYFRHPFFINLPPRSWNRLVYFTGPGLFTASIVQELKERSGKDREQLLSTMDYIGDDFKKYAGFFRMVKYEDTSMYVKKIMHGLDLVDQFVTK